VNLTQLGGYYIAYYM